MQVTLLEIDTELSSIAAENITRNGLAGRVRAVALDVTASADEFAANDIGPGSADGVLMNTAIAAAEDSVKMARAMRLGVEAGRLAYESGRMAKKLYASASSPLAGVVGT